MNSRWAPAALALLLLVFFVPALVRGAVVFPHDNGLQVGEVATAPDEGEASNLRFSDQSSFYVPELNAHLHAPRSGWIATWTDDVQLGRPLTHLSGFSPAYPPTWLLMRVLDDAFVVYHALFVLTVAATALFAFLFFRALELDPWIACAGAAAAALSVPMIYWATFLMNASGFCWTYCLLWLVTRQLARPTLGAWTGIAAASYALAISGYPQQVVWHAAFLVCWSIWRAVRGGRGAGAAIGSLALLALAALAGIAAAAPVLLDIALALQRSARVDVPTEFFLGAVPTMESARDVIAQLALLVDPRFVGSAIEPSYPLNYSGVGVGPIVAIACLLSWRAGAWRTLVPAHALIAVALACQFSPAVFRIGIEHLGLGFSRHVPSWGAIVPATVCAAVALDGLVRNPLRGRWIVLTLVIAGIAVLRWSVAPLVGEGEGAAWLRVLGWAVAAAVAVLFVRRAELVALVALALPLAETRELLLVRPRESIRTDSPLVAGLRERLASGGRYALVGSEPRFLLPANQELLLDLASVHSYDSLSSQAYQQWVLRISSEGARTFGRRFNRIQDDSRLAGGELERAGVTHLLSARELRGERLTPDGVLGPMRVYRTLADTALAVVLPAERVRAEANGFATRGEWTRVDAAAVTRIDDAGDRVRFELEPASAERWLVLRRQHHPQWRATSGDVQLESALVDGIHQGVRVPAGVTELMLEFRPWSRWSWVSWPVFALAALFAARNARRRRSA